MKSYFIKILITTITIISIFSCNQTDKTLSNLEYVDPHIGGMGHLLHPTRPNVQLPNQMIRMHPLRAD